LGQNYGINFTVDKSSPKLCCFLNLHKSVQSKQAQLAKIRPIGGQCFDHNFGRFLPIFGEIIGVFLKNQCKIKFLQKEASV
jgi:hypothetical protein